MSKKKMIIISIVSILILVIGVGGYFYYDSIQKEKILDSIQVEFNDMSEIEYGSTIKGEDFIKDCSGNIVEYGNIDSQQVGNQTLKFVVEKDGYTKEFTYECVIKDTKAPEIVLTKDKDTLKYGSDFDVEKYIKSIKDPIDGDLTYKKVGEVQDGDLNYYTYQSDVDTKSSKEYIVRFVAVDKNNNKAEKTLTIIVQKEEKKESPSSNETSSNSHSSNYTASPNNKVIVIDPGHQGKGNSSKEAVGPGASTMKAKVSTGATGISSRKAESQINLEVGLKLKDELQARGYTVIMTRTSQNVDISNQQRAQVGNQNNAAAVIHLHCDSSDNSSVRGAHTIAIANNNPYCAQLYNASSTLAKKVINSYTTATGIKSRGVSYRNDLTGLNWSEVPAIYIEMGFISNSSEDNSLSSSTFQNKCAKGIADGLDQYFS